MMMSSPLLARKGRHQQRYENQLRLVAGCIPYKLTGESDKNNLSGDLLNTVQVLMVASPGRHDLVFPKGGWEDDETASQAACREALEEAGVRGIINETELGCWVFKSKSRENTCSLEGACKGCMFALEVTEELDYWPEQKDHGRKWVTIAEAFKLCRYDWMREALARFKDQLLANATPSVTQLSEPSSFSIVKSTTSEHAVALCLPVFRQHQESMVGFTSILW